MTSLVSEFDIASVQAEEKLDPAVVAAIVYRARGWKVVPVEPGTKSPKIKDWPALAAADAFPLESFAGMNVGIVWGPVSGGVVDVDLDCDEAVRLAPAFLPPTLTYGHAPSKPASHWLYICDGLRSLPLKYLGDVILELRAQNASNDDCGHQSVAPGSVHKSGEPIEFDGVDFDKETPVSSIAAGELRWAAKRLAVACIILRDWLPDSGRRTKSLALSAFLLEAGWTAEEVRELFDAVREAAGDSKAQDQDFGHQVETTIAAFESGGPLTSIGTLVAEGVIDQRTANELTKLSRTPEAELRAVKLASTGAGAGMRRAMIAEARNVDAGVHAANIVSTFDDDTPADDSGSSVRTVSETLPANDDDPWALLGSPVDFGAEAEPLAYLVEGLPFAPGGKVNALAGPPKGSKSPFAMLLAISVATGRSFLGRRILHPGPVLYLDAETGRLAHIRYRRICRAVGIDPTEVPLAFRNVEARFSSEYLTALESMLRATPKRLVVIDTYGAMLEGGIDYNSPDFAHYLKELGLLSRRLDVVILVLIHEKKSGGGRSNGLEMISGSFSAAGAMQGVVSLRPEGEGNDSPIVVSCSRAPEDDFAPFRMRWVDVRDPAEPSPGEVAASGFGNPGRWGLRAELVEGEPAPPTRKGKGAAADEDGCRRILEALAEGPLAMRGIRKAVDRSYGTEKRPGIGKDRLARLVALLVERRTVVESCTETSGSALFTYRVRETIKSVG